MFSVDIFLPVQSLLHSNYPPDAVVHVAGHERSRFRDLIDLFRQRSRLPTISFVS